MQPLRSQRQMSINGGLEAGIGHDANVSSPRSQKRPRRASIGGRLEAGIAVDANPLSPLIRNVGLFGADRQRALPELPSRWRNWRRPVIFIPCLLLIGAVIGVVAGNLMRKRGSQFDLSTTFSDQNDTLTPGAPEILPPIIIPLIITVPGGILPTTFTTSTPGAILANPGAASTTQSTTTTALVVTISTPTPPTSATPEQIPPGKGPVSTNATSARPPGSTAVMESAASSSIEATTGAQTSNTLTLSSIASSSSANMLTVPSAASSNSALSTVELSSTVASGTETSSTLAASSVKTSGVRTPGKFIVSGIQQLTPQLNSTASTSPRASETKAPNASLSINSLFNSGHATVTTVTPSQSFSMVSASQDTSGIWESVSLPTTTPSVSISIAMSSGTSQPGRLAQLP
ncbi:hypothetical protein BD779DRAFT_1541609, partial [Infundibulicybe gibba]